MGYEERDAVNPRRSYRANLNAGRTSVLGGAMLVLFGSLLFLDNLSILPVSVFAAFWPVFFMGLGAYGFLRSCSPVVRVWSAAAFVAGLLWMLDAFRVIHVTASVVWPLALIASGLTMLLGRFEWTQFAGQFTLGSNSASRMAGVQLNEVAVFSGVKRRIESQGFEGGELTCGFGAIEIDLRKAGISTPGKVAVVEANAAFGAIELRIPESWRLSMQGVAVFGAYEDKTIPPRPDPGSETPTLVIRGGTAFGAVVVKN